MVAKKRPETIEERWDILYSKYPEVYDELAASEYADGKIIKTIRKIVNLKNKTVVDIGSGTGLSTFEIAKYAKFVYGIEPENSMKKVAIKKAKKMNIKNIKFLKGQAEKIPLKKDSVDMATAFTSIPSNYSDFSNIPKMVKDVVKEVSRVVKKNGYFIIANLPPRWGGGELAPVLHGKTRESKDSVGLILDKSLRKEFKYKDIFVYSRFGSLKKALEVYGFIFGRKAINYLKKHNKTTIKWKFRIYYKVIK
jgi:ubiquinone/menaquinone biosynthesis C-methylase UbiE